MSFEVFCPEVYQVPSSMYGVPTLLVPLSQVLITPNILNVQVSYILL